MKIIRNLEDLIESGDAKDRLDLRLQTTQTQTAFSAFQLVTHDEQTPESSARQILDVLQVEDHFCWLQTIDHVIQFGAYDVCHHRVGQMWESETNRGEIVVLVNTEDRGFRIEHDALLGEAAKIIRNNL